LAALLTEMAQDAACRADKAWKQKQRSDGRILEGRVCLCQACPCSLQGLRIKLYYPRQQILPLFSTCTMSAQ
jgi:hypothetical protein